MKKGLLLILPILAIFLTLQTNFFKIKSIKCSVEEETCPDELSKRLKKLENKSIFFTNLELEISQILSEQTTHSLNSISKEIPDKIALSFKKQVEINPKFAQLNLEKDEISQKDQQKILSLLNSAKDNKIEISKIKVDKGLFVLEIDNMQVIMKDNSELAIKKLAVILEKFNFEEHGTQIAEIDLRFKLPVLRENKTQF
ncbi:MAG: hypothetical protein ABFQ62_03550 [Patescibacteria group bacterium]